ncbi:hypothetical protein CH63R_14529 [Colletotrichum higginsianum IMI 349063]|uniref:Uncharacterized protein n=1 Tax=Colletotrichum higginsianum (strain IMI 349063) TaxID=759273 RepID=A0A1B7XQC4_COLHI|nr:hypothetical protein CH63R_14529 [Colletotrichum higginsianum IMI 349063]OBR01957.1 hypothetical protein CH63R_14529 [Colletotrichum higginsianum IMI 349063]
MSMSQKSFASTGYKTCRWIRKETVFYLPATSFPKKAKDGLHNVYVLPKDGKELHVKTFSKTSKTFHLCRAVFSTSCRGRDFFSGEEIGKGESGSDLTLDTILEQAAKDKPDLLKRPLFLCVGVDFVLMSDQSLPDVGATLINGSLIMCLLVK